MTWSRVWEGACVGVPREVASGESREFLGAHGVGCTISGRIVWEEFCMKLVELTLEDMEREAKELGVALPIEQRKCWAELEETIEGKSFWGAARIEREGQTCAFVSFIDYLTHGYHYLRSVHGPAWVKEPSAEDEQEMLAALIPYVKAHDRHVVFVRLCVKAELAECRPTLSTIPYNQTVVIDLTGGADEILARMKPRGRRDVRKALRESPATYADETALATESFAPYYEVMLDTATRDGFTAGTCERYEQMVRILGPEHCRVFCGRVEGVICSWAIVNISDGRAVYYFGASRSGVEGRNYITDGLIFHMLKTLSEEGVKTFDMRGIGNDFAPSLKSLNTFKCKFSEDVVDVAPERDVAVKPLVYASLVKARSLLHRGA